MLLLVMAGGSLLVLCLAAMWQRQYQLVQIILTSGFAVAAGASLRSVLRARTGDD